ncbi:MAG: fumarylacetoacetate hydrolase family protein [Paracoccus sp. (in: a-proteobacteria)]|uniref:fumarylacetoacetate hydrolase family protein n=1 Tax=Paracoccus sp. TaxID=267 RepID=UPI0039E4C823
MQNAARGWIAGQRLPDPLVWNYQDARCAYDSFRGVLESQLGPPVGVKVGPTSLQAQRRFGVSQPNTGLLFAPMLVPNGSKLSLKGSRQPYYEADLVVTVGDAAIMQARTRAEAAAALSEIRPFIELPDMALGQGVTPTGPLHAAYGGMPWRGVLGKGIPVRELADPVAALAEMSVALKVDGKPVIMSRGDVLMGHPLDVVLWLVAQRSYELKPGSIISLGSFGRFGPATPGRRLEAEYELAGRPMRVWVTLVP